MLNINLAPTDNVIDPLQLADTINKNIKTIASDFSKNGTAIPENLNVCGTLSQALDSRLVNHLGNLDYYLSYYKVNTYSAKDINKPNLFSIFGNTDHIATGMLRRLDQYLKIVLSVVCFEGKTMRNYVSDVKYRIVCSGGLTFIYIDKIMLGKTTNVKAKSSTPQENSFTFEFDEQGNVSKAICIAESLKNKFNDQYMQEVLKHIDVLMERFNRNVGVINKAIREGSLSYKHERMTKTHTEKRVGYLENLVDLLQKAEMTS